VAENYSDSEHEALANAEKAIRRFWSTGATTAFPFPRTPIRRFVALHLLNRDSRLLRHPCIAVRLGGVSGGKATHGWRDCSHTAIAGAGNSGSPKLPMATAT
jgi:hypothetical protein